MNTKQLENELAAERRRRAQVEKERDAYLEQLMAELEKNRQLSTRTMIGA